MHAILFVLDDPQKLNAVLEAWAAIGVDGATIFESTGYARQRVKRLHFPIRYALPDASDDFEGHVTLFVIVREERLVQSCLQEAERLVGDLNAPNTGVFAAWPLAFVKGVSPQGRAGEGGDDMG
jgi:nitrogen regulatory protein PII